MADKMDLVYKLIELGGNVHLKNDIGLNALYYTKGPLQRSQVLKRWELMSPEVCINHLHYT